MKPLKYLNDMPRYSEHAYNALKGNFASRECFNSFLATIEPPKRRDLFLRLASFYRFLVKEGHVHFSNPDWCSGLRYIEDTFKFISVFSLIEASFLKDEFIDFYEFLTSKKSPVRYAIEGHAELEELYRQYKEEYGAIQNAVKFFDALDEECKRNLAEKLKTRAKPLNEAPDEIREWEHESIVQLAKRLYNMRSDFVHKAEFVLTLNEGSSISVGGSKVILNYLTSNDMTVFFEHGLLTKFGYSAVLPHSKVGCS